MRVVVVRNTMNGEDRGGADLFAYALATDPLRRVILDGARRMSYNVPGRQTISKLVGPATSQDLVWLVPQSWRGCLDACPEETAGCVASGKLDSRLLGRAARYPWATISNGRFAAHISGSLLEQVLRDCGTDALAVTVAPELLAYRERVRITQDELLVGYRRLFRDAAEPTPLPRKWPHHFFIRSERFERVLRDGIPEDFATMLERCRACDLKVQAMAMAGFMVNMDTPGEVLRLSEVMWNDSRMLHAGLDTRLGRQVWTVGTADVSPEARLLGPVLLGGNVCVEAGALVIGPSVLCEGSTVRQGAVLDSSILGARAVAEENQTLRRRFVVAADGDDLNNVSSGVLRPEDAPEMTYSPGPSVFRAWPTFSYARCFKRVVDVVIALVVLLLFIPVIPVIALAIKISSPGPVFFKDKRQGLHGRLFDCIKFRTMRVGAADIQDKLRFVSEVDGPQFKMADDPRISTVGRFLRETYLDEIPQFYNVLCGQMSVVGPRPSPESENTLCPSWRDARLSVRPGITGLWQVYRTRRPFKDFQEWIYYDTKYVRQLSPRMDLWICWCTFKKMVANFAAQF